MAEEAGSNDQEEKIDRQRGWQWAEVPEACAFGRLSTCESDREMVPDLAVRVLGEPVVLLLLIMSEVSTGSGTSGRS